MNRSTIVVLKTLIAVLIALLLFSQVVVVPQTAEAMAMRHPEFGRLQIPGIVIGVAFTLCAEIVLVCVWRLLSLVRADGIFTERAFAWVDAALGAVIVATLLIAGALGALQAAGASASIAILCVIGIVVGAGLSLLIVVLRGLLKKAAQLEHDLSEVV